MLGIAPPALQLLHVHIVPVVVAEANETAPLTTAAADPGPVRPSH